MSDLTRVAFWECITASSDDIQIQGKTGNYIVHYGNFGHNNPTVECDFSCNCKGFKFRGICSHIKKAKPLHCGWMENIHGGSPVDGKCPQCGKAVVSRDWMV